VKSAIRLLLAIVMLCLARPAAAIDPDRAMSQYIRDQWGSERGFPGGPVHAITQTADGYLWIAAEKGLVRFDGLTFRLFNPVGPTSEAQSSVLGVEVDRDGVLWVRLQGAALIRYSNGRFENMLSVLELPTSLITAMTRGHDGAILLTTLGQGAVAYRAGTPATVAARTKMSSSFVIAVAEPSAGDIWLGTRDTGVIRVQGEHVTAITQGLPDQKVNCLLPGDNGEVWIGTDSGVVRWTGSEISSAGLPPGLDRVRALAMVRDRQSNVWIATTQGLLRVNAHGLSSLAEAPGALPRTVTSTFEDRDGNLWVGTTRGIERWRDGVFTTYSTAQGLPSDSTGSIYVDEAERAWFAPPGGGLYWLRDGRVSRVSEAGLDQDVVYSIAGGMGDVWVGRQRGGLTRLRVGGDRVSADRFTQADGLAQNNVYAVHRARDGAVWAGTLSGGASRFKDGVFTTYAIADGLASNTVSSIVESSDGTMWFATPNGVSTLSRGGWRRYSTKEGLPSNDVNVLFEDVTNNVWAGTAAGLALFQSGGLQATPDLPDPLRGSILGIAEDRFGWLWIAVSDRILRVNREALTHSVVSGGDLREYGIADGLAALEGVKRNRSVVADGRGRIWFAMARGISMADPDRAEGRALPALAQIEELSVDGAPQDVRSDLKIASAGRRITLSYTGLSLAVPERVLFRYRLDGFDRDWSEPASARQAAYTNLPPGAYRFRVIASNSDQIWNGAEAAVRFEIEPSIWQTAWFRSMVALSGIISVWALYRLRVMRVARQLSGRFEERLAERTRIAQELHDTLLQGFMSASMQLYVAAERLPAESPEKSALTRVIDLMGRVIEEGRSTVRGLRSSSSAPHDLEQAFTGIHQEIAIPEQTEYRVIVEGQAKGLNPIIRDEVYRIGREALFNAVRHSHATSIEIELEYGRNGLRILVRDDGRGIDEQVIRVGADGHWGMTGMRERAERIGGAFKVRSRAGAGTEVELLVPAEVAYNSDHSGNRRGWAARFSRRRTPSTTANQDTTEKD
jgi:signal transduction histidine kinase/ligand-binding sensor domain-containing protein